VQKKHHQFLGCSSWISETVEKKPKKKQDPIVSLGMSWGYKSMISWDLMEI
jgi:hypothetical protein